MDSWNPSTLTFEIKKSQMAISMDEMLLDEDVNYRPKHDEYDSKKYLHSIGQLGFTKFDIQWSNFKT